MRLTNILMFYVRRRHIPGKITTGKHRIIPHITCSKKKGAMKQMVAEEKNMNILSQPYITEEEDRNHERDMGLIQEKRQKEKEARIERTWLSPRTMDGQMEDLKRHSKWE